MNIQENISLKNFNTFHISEEASFFASFHDQQSLKDLLIFKKDMPLLCLGGGSNILLTKKFEGLIIKNEIKGISVNIKQDDIFITAGAGENWHELVMYCVDHNYGGLENLSLIPGNVGASPMQNIGAYGVEIKDIFEELEAYDLFKNKVVIFNNAACRFGYRESIFKNEFRNRFIIMNVTYRLTSKPVFNISYGAIEKELEKMNVTDLSVEAVSSAVIRIRRSKLPDPAEIGNAGSFFKNPEISEDHYEQLKKAFPHMPGYKIAGNIYKVPAGWLIEQCGWKGYRKGDAGCHKHQALVLVNYGDCNGNEILELAGLIITSVYEKYQITLQPEVNII